MNRQAGFTLIELIVVIVILGILGAVALPKFVDLSGEASTAAVKGVAGSLGAASALNYSACKAGDTSCVPGTVMVNCTDAEMVMVGYNAAAATPLGTGLPANYAITSLALGVAGTSTSCTLTGDNGATATFSAIKP